MADKKKMVEIPVNTPIGKGGRASIEKVPAGGEKHKRYLKSKNNPDSPFFVREGFSRGDRVNTSRENRLEELGRVDAEKAYTSKGARNLKDEKKRRNVAKFGKQTKPYDPPTKEMKTSMGKFMQKTRQDMHKAKRGVKQEEVVLESDKKGKGSGTKDACYHKVKSVSPLTVLIKVLV